MKVVIQRVNSACVRVEGEIVGQIGQGLLLLVGFGPQDTLQALKPLCQKILNMRLFPREKNKFDLSILDTKGEILVVSQFTLYADTSKGRRPEFFGALEPQTAKELYSHMLEEFRNAGATRVESGIFGAYMQVSSENDGPVTILLES